jgi:hypothetical protein
LVLREVDYGGGDLLPRLLALDSVELLGGDGYRPAISIWTMSGWAARLWYHAGCLGAPAADATISQLPSLPGNPADGSPALGSGLAADGRQDQGVKSPSSSSCRCGGSGSRPASSTTGRPRHQCRAANRRGFQHMYRSSCHLLPCSLEGSVRGRIFPCTTSVPQVPSSRCVGSQPTDVRR